MCALSRSSESRSIGENSATPSCEADPEGGLLERPIRTRRACRRRRACT